MPDGSRPVAVRPVSVITPEQAHARRLSMMRRNVLTSARLHAEEATAGGFRGRWALLTLTYRDGEQWLAKQVSALLNHIRMFCTRAGFVARYTWVLELTQRGRPHYHVLIWLPRGRTLPKPDKRGWWPHGNTRIEWVKRSGAGYISKYASKGFSHADAKNLPGGARLSGFGGLSKQGRIELRWWKAPAWIREMWSSICDLGRSPGGWVNRDTGEYAPGRWRVVWYGGALNLCEVIQ